MGFNQTAATRFNVVHRLWGTNGIVSMTGAVDLLTTPALESAIAACLAERPAALIIDLTGSDFLASVGIAALMKASETAAERGMGFSVVADGPATSRPIGLLGLSDDLNLQPTVADARESLGDNRSE